MVNTIDMRQMRYINLFGKVTGIRTRHCFSYNDFIVFAVPKMLVSKAVGKEGANVKKLSMTLGKKIKIIPLPGEGVSEKAFIEAVVNPVTFKEMDDNEGELVITAGSQSKAALIGRNKRRLLELQKIAKGFFGKELRIV